MEIIRLNLIPSGVNPICHAKQYDKGRTIRFELFNGLTPYTLQSGDTVTLNLRKPDNTIIESSVTATQGNKHVDLVTTEQMCAVAGYNLGTFKIENGATEIGTLNFIMEVGKDVLANGIPSQSVIEDLDALVAEAVEADLGDNYYNKTEVDEIASSKADATATAEALGGKANNSIVNPFIIQSTVYFDSAQTGGTTDYYLKINKPVIAGNYYLLKVKSTTAGTYTLRCGTSASISSMVDTIGEVTLEANVEKDIFWYIPTGNYLYFGIGANVDWSIEVYAIFDNAVIQETVKEVDNVDVSLGEELMNDSGVYTVGFTGDLANGYTYDGTTDNGRLRFTLNISKDKIYLLEFDCSYSAGECVGVCCSGYDYVDPIALCYNGTNHIVIPIKSYGVGLFLNFFVQNKVSFTLTNITFKEITLIGYGSKTLTLDSVMSKSNNKNLGFWNVFLGVATADDTVSGTRTIAIGNYALGSLKTGNRNIGIGTFAMSQLVRGENNISIGADTMLSVDEGYDNIAIGKSAMYDGQNVANNIAIGDYALSGSGTSTQQYNVAIGQNSAIHGVGNGNTMVGHQAGYRFSSNNYNVMVGFNTLGRSSGDYNVCIGCLASFASGVNNSIAIGKSVEADKSNQMKLGNAEITEVVFCGNKKINFNQDGTVTWETLT